MSVTRLELLHLIDRVWPGARMTDPLPNGIGWSFLLHGQRGAAQVHSVDGNGHPTCHSGCAEREAQRPARQRDEDIRPVLMDREAILGKVYETRFRVLSVGDVPDGGSDGDREATLSMHGDRYRISCGELARLIATGFVTESTLP